MRAADATPPPSALETLSDQNRQRQQERDAQNRQNLMRHQLETDQQQQQIIERNVNPPLVVLPPKH